VIGRLCRQVPRERVPRCILGYTCANDVTARDAQKAEGQWARAKGFDTSARSGRGSRPNYRPGRPGHHLHRQRRAQAGRAHQPDDARDRAELVAFISEAMTLLPGDVILTGTPAGVGPMNVGDLVSVSIEGIGTLTNRIVKRTPQAAR
jgi:2-keto-4-pentenoate hydratase/2-oxohepta-3-ene-1,7-dioic acid hydratase in catechol pathway